MPTSMKKDTSQLKNEIIRKSYTDKLVEKLGTIEPTHNLDDHARKKEYAI